MMFAWNIFPIFILDLNLEGCQTGTAGNNLIVKSEAKTNHNGRKAALRDGERLRLDDQFSQA